MRRKYQDSNNSSQASSSPQALTEVNFQLITRLTHWLADNEEAQRNFRTAVIGDLARIHSLVTMIHGAQIVQSHGFKPGHELKIKDHAKASETYVAESSRDRLRVMLEYIYRERPKAEPRRDRRKKWWGWEI